MELEQGLFKPQGKRNKGKFLNNKRKWKDSENTWIPKVMVELPLKPLDLFLL